MNEPIVIRHDVDGVAKLTLNRPETMNVLNPSLGAALSNALSNALEDNAIRVVMLNALGSSFMAGGDIRFFATLLGDGGITSTQLSPMFDTVHGVIRMIREAPKPVIASVGGSAAGFGLSLMLACDMAIAAKGTTFTLAYCHLGVSPDGGSTWSLPRIVGLKKALELALLGDRFDADQALAMGLINNVVADAELDTASMALAARLAAGPQQALARTKALLNASLQTPLNEQLQAEQQAFIDCAQGAEFAEGVSAFVEKRAANFIAAVAALDEEDNSQD
jgi:2-(1,2-epoxy-1,2-dihydrophenyl)acetyl-CoA isomerase